MGLKNFTFIGSEFSLVVSSLLNQGCDASGSLVPYITLGILKTHAVCIVNGKNADGRGHTNTLFRPTARSHYTTYTPS